MQRPPADPRRVWRTGIEAFFTAFSSHRAVARAGSGGAGHQPGDPGPVVGLHAEVDRPDRGRDQRRTRAWCRTGHHPGGRPRDVAEPDERAHHDGHPVRRAAGGQRGPRRRHPHPHLGQPASTAQLANSSYRVCEHMFVRCDASILHADLDSFYASVEQRDDPTLRGRPVIVGGGVVLAASYEAKAYGVRTAMGGAQARRLCPHAVVVPPRMTAYSRASDDVFEVFRDTTPIVEPLSVDEAFLDVGGLRRVSGHAGRRSRRGCAPTCATGSACPSPSGSRERSSSRRSPARKPSPTGCCWCRPIGSWRSCIRCRCAGCGAWVR